MDSHTGVSALFWQDPAHTEPWQEEKQVYYLEPGTIVTIENFTLQQDIVIPYAKPPQDKLECVYCLSGEGQIEEPCHNRLTEIGTSVRSLSWQSCGEGIFRLYPTCPTKAVHIYFSRKTLAAYLGDDPAVLEKFVRAFTVKNSLYGRTGTTPPMIETLIYQMFSCPRHGFARRLFFHAKVAEILALEMEYWTERQETASFFLSEEDMFCLQKAREILFFEYQEPPSLEELARKVGINRNKLTTGFRQLFGTTVWSALKDIRLEKAKQLLDSGEKSVSEAAFAVGYNNAGHFSELFYKRYGVLPGKYLLNVKSMKRCFSKE